MNFKLLIGDKGNVDFNRPVDMTKEEKDRFIQLIESFFDRDVIKVKNVEEFRDWRVGGDRVQYPRVWTGEEYEVLLKTHLLEVAIDKLGRSGMAILVQDGIWRPRFLSWCNKNGKNPFEEDTLKIIKEFMKEQEDLKKLKKQKIKQKRELLEKKESLEERIPKLERLEGVGDVTKEGILKLKQELEEIKKLLKD